MKNACQRGRNCNFYHIFKNPNGKYAIGEMDLKTPNPCRSQRTASVHNEENDEYVSYLTHVSIYVHI